MKGVKVKEVVIEGKELDRINKILEKETDFEKIIVNLLQHLKNNGCKMEIDYEAMMSNNFNFAMIDFLPFEGRPRLTVRKNK